VNNKLEIIPTVDNIQYLSSLRGLVKYEITIKWVDGSYAHIDHTRMVHDDWFGYHLLNTLGENRCKLDKIQHLYIKFLKG